MKYFSLLLVGVILAVPLEDTRAIDCPVAANPTGNLLANPGIEFCGIDGAGDNAVPAGWEMDESILADAVQTESLAEGAFYNHRKYTGDGGNDIGRFWNMWFKPYVGTFVEIAGVPQEDNYAHLFQDVPGTPGMQYTMTGYVAFEPFFAGGVTNLNWEEGDPGMPNPDPNVTNDGRESPTDFFFALEFLDSMGNVLSGSVQKELFAAGQTNVPPQLPDFWNNDDWTQQTLVGIAPAGTTEVRVRASMIDGVANPGVDPQSAFVDAFSLIAEEVEGLPGDFDNDLDVDGRDFLVWQRGGSPSPLSASDLADWESNYGSPLVTITAVPEPASGILLGIAVLSTCYSRRTRCKLVS